MPCLFNKPQIRDFAFWSSREVLASRLGASGAVVEATRALDDLLLLNGNNVDGDGVELGSCQI